MTMRRAILALAVLAIMALAAWALRPRPVPVDVAVLAHRTIEVTVEDEGRAEIRDVFRVSAPIAGRLYRINLHAGDPVVAGETVVARIGPVLPTLLDARSRAVAAASLAAAEAAVDLAKAQVTQAEATHAFRVNEAERTAALFDRAAVARHVLDLAVLERATALAALDSARANLAVRERERDSAAAVLHGADTGADTCCVELTAPVSGRVLRVVTEDDQVVASGTSILEIGDPGDLRVRVDLLSRDAVRVQPGAVARITGWGGPDLPAEVERVEPSAVTRTSALGIEEQRVEVLLRLTGPVLDRQALGHGYRVLARITLEEVRDALAIPVGALFRDESDWATYTVVDGRARLQRIEIGARDDTFAQVVVGLQAGAQVILHPSDLLADGVAAMPRVEAGPIRTLGN